MDIPTEFPLPLCYGVTSSSLSSAPHLSNVDVLPVEVTASAREYSPVWQNLRKHWREFKRGKPGRRFQERYERNRREHESGPAYLKVLRLALALGLFLVGCVLVFIPGPAVLFFALSASVLSGQSKRFARSLDFIEVRGRRVYAVVRRKWKAASVLARGAVISLGALGVGAAGYFTYELLVP